MQFVVMAALEQIAIFVTAMPESSAILIMCYEIAYMVIANYVIP